MTKLADLSAAQMVAVFNHYADKPVTKFASAAIGRARLVKLLAGIDAPECKAIAAVLAPAKGRAKAPTPRPAPATASGASKKDQAIALLTRKSGISGTDLAEAMGWLPHTMRAFVSVLGKTMTITSERKDGTTVYRAKS